MTVSAFGLLISNQAISKVHEGIASAYKPSYEDIIYHVISDMDSLYLLDQAHPVPMSEEEAYQHLNRELQKHLLPAVYRGFQTSGTQYLLKDLVSGGFSALVLAQAMKFPSVKAKIDSNPIAVMSIGMGLMGIATRTVNIIGEGAVPFLTNGAVISLRYMRFITLGTPLSNPDAFTHYEVNLLMNSYRLSRRTRETIAHHIFQQKRAQFNNYEERGRSQSDVLLEKYLKDVLGIPNMTKQKDVVFNQTQFLQDVDGLDQETSRQLVSLARSYARDSIEERKEKRTALFLGAPGTGKTRSANMLAKSLGLQICARSLDGKSSLQEALGGLAFSSSYSDSKNTPGFLGECMIEHQTGQFVLLLDEFDKYIKFNYNSAAQFLHFFLDKTTNELDSPYFGKLDISNILIIIIGNDNFATILPGNNMAALEQRIQLIVNFKDFSNQIKKQLFDREVQSVISKYPRTIAHLLSINVTESDLNTRMQKNIADMNCSYMEESGLRKAQVCADRAFHQVVTEFENEYENNERALVVVE